MNSGIIPINKPKDWTSFDVVNKIKKYVWPHKIGHLGTLDPMATGVLLVTVNKATKLFDLMQEKNKQYIAKFEFGYTTDTLDKTGKITNSTNNIPTKQMIEKVLNNFIGEIDQIPPKYSAKSINGKRAYDMARNNIDFELKPVKVRIDSIEIIDYIDNILTLKIDCGSGTYIRSIGRDIAICLDSLACMTELVRVKVGSFKLENCYNVDEISKDSLHLIDIDKVLIYPTLNLDDEEITRLLNGQRLKINKNDGLYYIKQQNEIKAIVKIDNFIAKMSIFLG